MRRIALLSGVFLAVAACESRVTLDQEVEGPAELSATAQRSRIQLTWDAVEGASHYEVFQGNAPGTSPEVHTRILTSSVPELSVQQVIPGTTYYFVVAAVVDGERTETTGEVSTAALEDTPLSTVPAWTKQGLDQAEYRFGASVAAAGDLNQDGRGDLAVGSPLFAGGSAPPIGQVEFFLGGGEDGGLLDTPVFSVLGKQTSGGFGTVLIGGHDINQDGFDDVLASEPHGFFESGRVYAYYGTDEGDLTKAPNGCYGPNFQECPFLFAPDILANTGTALAIFEDRTGDGLPDVLTGAPFVASTAGGMVELYQTTEIGSTSYPPAFQYQSPELGDAFGASVAAGRDVNGDGIEDAIAGAPLGGAGLGRVALLLGTGGTLSAPAWSALGALGGEGFGSSVVLADLSCDGLADVVVGVPGADDLGIDAGRVDVFHGGTLPLSSTPDESLFGLAIGERFGTLADVGDVDGDGCDDLLVGSPSFDGVFVDEGRAQVFRGGAEGIDTTPVWTDFGRFPLARYGEAVSSAGDVDGDSFTDVVVGAPDYDDSGLVSVYRGLAPSGPRVSAGLPSRVNAGSPHQPQLAGFSDPTSAQTFTCTWSWDDGEEDTVIELCNPLTAGGVTHVWQDPGRYVVRLRVDRQDGVAGEAVTTVIVE